ncbi:MAG: ABC-F family ATP-binding cassette domain-containing protein [Spirochaetaceae bacterium]|nr:ABC-F family ATP-binding cassette domain-containing protein [Spirochaetaceae bacterium]
MNLLSINGLTKIGREVPLFKNVTFGLNEGDKVALIGRNGTGKSTLLGCIAGRIASDDGTVVTNKTAGVSFLPQNPEFNPEHTISEHIFSGTSTQLQLIRSYESLCEKITVYQENGKTLSENDTRELAQLTELMTEKDLWNYENSIKSILTTLGIRDLNRKMKTLSGGMVKKVALAQVLIDDTKILLLDEPTNHLDITTIAWLEDYLKNTNRSVLMVTHDRYFLDEVCTCIYELAHQNLKMYEGNFSTYLEKKAIELEIAENTERRIESVLRTEREWLMRGPQARGTKARARVDAVNKMINREKLEKEKTFAFEVKERRLGGKVLEVEHVSKSFSDSCGNTQPVIQDFSYIFSKGEKIGIFGDNGTGKTTLLNLLTENLLPDSGTLIKGDNTHFAYYKQNPQFAHTSLTVLEYIKETAEVITLNNGKTLSATQMLEQFGFEGKILYSPVTALSGGEQKRLYLARLLMTNPNFLVLDEPTNDFDIFTMSILESFLQNFQGCLLVVSHDRYFMDKCADTLFILEEDGSVSGFVGSCSEYIQVRKQNQEDEELRLKKEKELQRKEEQNSVTTEKKKKRSFKEQKEFEEIETLIMELEEQKSLLEEQMTSTDYEVVKKAGEQYILIEKQLAEKYTRWEYLAELGN